MRDKAHYIRIFAENPDATIGLLLAARAVYAARYGDADDMDDARFREIAHELKEKYGESLANRDVIAEMNQRYTHGPCAVCGWVWVNNEENPIKCGNRDCRSTLWTGRPAEKRGPKKEKPAD